jgi:hypothetical protein
MDGATAEKGTCEAKDEQYKKQCKAIEERLIIILLLSSQSSIEFNYPNLIQNLLISIEPSSLHSLALS